MKQDLTEIVFLIDRSGSMSNLTEDTVGGFNSFIKEQKEKDGEAKLTTVLFDNYYEIFHDGVDIKNVKNITNKDCYARGATALLDAIGKTINEVGCRLNGMAEDEKPSKVIFIITTDGQENASREFTVDVVKKIVETQTNVFNWQFLFLGANIDSFSSAMSIGIQSAFVSNYSANHIGGQSVYNTVNKTVSSYRTTGNVDTDWAKDVK
jgi:uncharacterized protein YegL